MLGLRTQESDKFINFFDVVQQNAAKQGSVFFLDTGEGHDIHTDTIEAQDLSGWLIPSEKVHEFDTLYQNGFVLDDDVSDKWNVFFRFAEWKEEDGKIKTEFVDYSVDLN